MMLRSRRVACWFLGHQPDSVTEDLKLWRGGQRVDVYRRVVTCLRCHAWLD